MRLVRSAAAAGIAAVILTACQGFLPAPPAPDAETTAGAGIDDGSSFEALTRYADWLREQPPDTLRVVYDDAEDRARSPGLAVDRIRLALLLSVPGTSFRDEPRALTLLQEELAASSDTEGNMRAFAAMLAANLHDRQWARADLQRRLSEERRRRQELEQKLEELKDIEQQLHRRDQTDSGVMQ